MGQTEDVDKNGSHFHHSQPETEALHSKVMRNNLYTIFLYPARMLIKHRDYNSFFRFVASQEF